MWRLYYLGDLEPSDNCTDYSETGYKCVPYYNCENGSIITDGGGIIGIRVDDSDRVILDPSNSICPGLLEVCCRSDDFFNQPVTKNKEVNYKMCLLKVCHLVYNKT